MEKPISFSNSLTSKYPKTVNISLALEKKFLLLTSVIVELSIWLLSVINYTKVISKPQRRRVNTTKKENSRTVSLF